MTTPTKPIRLYRHALSGHAHRVELFLSRLGLPCELIDVNIVRAPTRRRISSPRTIRSAKIPVIEDGDVAIADSIEILVYLATRYDGTGRWLPRAMRWGQPGCSSGSR